MANENQDEQLIKERWPWIIAFTYLYQKIGVVSVILLFIAGTWTGYVPSPLLDMAKSMEKHLEQSQVTISLIKQNQEILLSTHRGYDGPPKLPSINLGSSQEPGPFADVNDG